MKQEPCGFDNVLKFKIHTVFRLCMLTAENLVNYWCSEQKLAIWQSSDQILLNQLLNIIFKAYEKHPFK